MAIIMHIISDYIVLWFTFYNNGYDHIILVLSVTDSVVILYCSLVNLLQIVIITVTLLVPWGNPKGL